jgi:hypothetical protein
MELIGEGPGSIRPRNEVSGRQCSGSGGIVLAKGSTATVMGAISPRHCNHPGRRKCIGTLGAFFDGLVIIPPEHQFSGASDVDLG